jgi:diguanylate cyclase (GGDEF)-like protein
MAKAGGVDVASQAALLALIVAVPALLALYRPAALLTRLAMTLALTCMPILFVFDNPGSQQIEFHLYFFVVFAMLVVFCDWRCIAASAALTLSHHLLFNFVAPHRVFPEPSLWRVAFHGVLVLVECGALIWAIAQLRRLFLTAERVQAMADSHAAVALTDHLTRLGNHRAFWEDLPRELSRANRHSGKLTLALIDVDDFKSVNDESGHKHGDEVLVAVANLLRTLRVHDRAYRIGGDEFAVMLVETNAFEANVALERMRDRAKKALSGVTLSIGHATTEKGGADQELFERADAVLYQAKRHGRNAVIGYDQLVERPTVFSNRKAAAVRKLISEELLDIAFQPIWDIHTASVVGFEALARPNGELGLAGPGEAFDLAERMHLVPELDRLCIRKSFEATANLPPDSVVFVNVSPASLEHHAFDPMWLIRAAEKAGLHPGQVVVEITERALTDLAALISSATTLRELGVRLALDDTGSGQAGLEALSRLQLAYVKIDRDLLCRARAENSARGVLAGIIAIARETGSYLIAEGVEDEWFLEFVRNAHVASGEPFLGIRGAQGYLLGRPHVGKIDRAALAEHRLHLTQPVTDSAA